MFENLSQRLTRSLRNVMGQGRLTEDNIKETLREVRLALLEADVALPVVKDFIAEVKTKALGTEVSQALNPGQEFLKIVYDELKEVMGSENAELSFATQPPAVILMAGLQGAGKTTSAAKLAKFLIERKKKSVMMVSADVYRPAAIDQLETLSRDVGAAFFPSTAEDKPLEIVTNALAAARKQFADVLIVDTAGRLHVDEDMMEEIKALHKTLNPVETLFVVDAMTGQDAANTAEAFNAALPLTGVILTKLDGDARGGAALSVRKITGKPIKFAGMGEKIAALEPFYPERMASRILDMGDVLSLVEEMERKFDKKKTAEMSQKMMEGKDFDLEDFKSQIAQMRSMGGMLGLMDKLPGMNSMPDEVKDKMDDKIIYRMEAIINSMTPKERRDPDIIKGSRKKRIADGAGVEVAEVTRLLHQFNAMKKMMRKLRSQGGIRKLINLARTMAGNGGMGGFFKKLKMDKGRKILPVGFLPSNIIANYYLSGFDQAVNDLLNPVYYGRYVDDILIVDKVESNTYVFKNDYNDFEKYILRHYLYPVIRRNDHDQYYIRNDFLPDNTVELKLNDNKFKLFHLESQNDVYFDKIKSFLLQNSSEFKFLIDDELLTINDFEKVYSFSVRDSSHHFGSINDVFVNKYELSKLLAKYSITCTLINDQKIDNFENQLSKILTPVVILDNYLLWDRIVEILVINSRFLYLFNFCNSVKNAVKTFYCDQSAESATLRQSLLFCLFVALCRNYPFVWSKERRETQEKIFNDIITFNDFDILNKKVYDINDVVLFFAKSHMIDKSVMVFLFNMFDINGIKKHLVDCTTKINITKFSDAKSYLKKYWSYTDYGYYPFVIPDYVCSIYHFVKKIKCLDSIEKPIKCFDDIDNLFNYDNLKPIGYRENDMPGDSFVINKEFKTTILSNNLKLAYVNVQSSEKKEKFKIALANIVVDKNTLELIIKNNPDRSHAKYQKLSKIVNLALEQHSDFLILPESCVPLEWLPYLSRISARNDLAIITGVEYIISGKYVCNATAVILPYDMSGYATARIFFHIKNHYAPEEIKIFNGLHPISGSGKYELYKWKDCYFSVYCCFELSSITDRSLFESYLDILFAIECNRDVNYYDHIVSSLSRDIHCYCVQVNTADYGDSRITKPSKTEEMNLIKVKGGINPIVIVDYINISDLRNFQVLQYALQKDSPKAFKPTPPNFNRDVVSKKIKGEDLLSYFDEVINGKSHNN